MSQDKLMYLLGTPNLDRLNLQNLPGVGLETEKKLNKHGIHKVTQLYNIYLRYKDGFCDHLLGMGITRRWSPATYEGFLKWSKIHGSKGVCKEEIWPKVEKLEYKRQVLVKTEPKPIFQPEIYAKTLPKSPIPAFQREILVKTETKSPSQAFQREVLVKVEPKTPSQGGVMVKTEPVQNPCQATVLSHGATNEKPKLEGCLNEEVKKNPMSCDSDKQIKGETSNPVRVVRKPNIKQSSKPDIQSTLDKIFINNKEGIAGIIGEKWVEPKNIHLYKTKKVLNKNIDCHGVSGSTPPTKSQGNSICNPPKYEKNISVRIEKSKWKMTKDEIENWFLFFGKNTEKLAWIPTKTIPEILLDTSKVEMMLQKHVLDPLPPNLVEVQQETSKSSFPFWQAEDVLKNEKPNWISTIRQVPDCYEGAVTSKMVGRWAAIFDNISFYETNLYQYSQICKTNV